MGGKNSAPAAPDYSQLAAASQKSADYAYQLATRQQDWAEKTYNDNKSTSDLVIDKALGALDKSQADADEARQRYQTIYQPLEDQFAAEAQDYASPERQEKEAGAAEADVAAQFAAARQTAQDRLESYGVDPSQTRAGALDLGSRVAEAAAQASAGNQARQNVQNTGFGLQQQAINIGRGYPAQIQGSQSGALQAGNQAANTGLATAASGAQTMGTGTGWQGLGNQAITGWGNILNAGYNNQLDAWKANQSASSGWGSLLGNVAGTAMTFLAEGGAIPDQPDRGRMLPHEMSPSHGAIPDDIPAAINSGQPAQLNAGEFIVPRDVVSWLGEKGMQDLILKARRSMGNKDQRPAQPEMGPPPGQGALRAVSGGALPAWG